MAEALVSRRERVFLTGFMGSGKSTVGPILANTIGYDFVDTDKAIQEATGKSVSDIFLSDGEEYFRSLERALVYKLCWQTNVVVSVGGGTVLDETNYRSITASGIVIYLKSDPERLFRRLHYKNDRPVLADERGGMLNTDDLRQRIYRLYAQREPIYMKADLVIVTDEKRVGLTVDEIVKKLTPLLRKPQG